MSEGRAGWRLARFGDFLRESRIPGSNGAVARKLIVRKEGRGVEARDDSAPGSEATIYYQRRAGQFIYSKLAFLTGAFGVVPDELDGHETTLDAPSFDVAPEVDARWLVAHVTRPAFYRRFAGLASGSRRAVRVPPRELLASRITLPPLDEQRAIADAIDAMASAVDATAALVEDLKAAKRWSMRRLLTRGDPTFGTEMMPLPMPWRIGRVAPDVSEMPSRWRLVRLVDVARLESGHTPSRKHPEYWTGDIPWLSLQDSDRLMASAVYDTRETIGPEGLANSSTRLLPAGTVALLRTASVGRCTRLGREMCTSQHYANWICGASLAPGYLVQVFRHMQHEWRRLSAGSVLPDVYMSVFKRLRILLPPLPEQRAIAAAGEAFDARIAAESAWLAELTTLRDGLARELLSGRLRLPPPLIARLAGEADAARATG